MRARALAAALAVAVTAALLTPAGHAEVGTASAQPDLTILSAPDFLNTDVGDVSQLPTYDGVHNSWNESYQTALDLILETWRSENPDHVLVAGDLVQGHWGMDSLDTGTFGPVGSAKRKRDAVRAAARFYYSEWTRRFAQHGLPRPKCAIGDHSLGDNPWRLASGGYQAFKHRSFRVFKNQYAKHVVRGAYSRHPPKGTNAARTAYSTWLSPEVFLVTVDVFRRTKENVNVELDQAQLEWLDNRLAAANRNGADWLIVQGHTPVIGPVRRKSSSGLRYQGGSASAFWRTMVRHEVDLYLAGEVHDVTLKRRNAITQISHGGYMPGRTNYLMAEVYGDRMRLTIKEFPSRQYGGARFWQTDADRWRPIGTTYQPPEVTGTAVIGKGRHLFGASGSLKPYDP